MKTNLILKRNETIDGVTQVVTKIVPVEIPYINRGEGWILSGHTDIIEIVQNNPFENKPAEQLSMNLGNTETTLLKKFQSDVPGTAKLVRSKGVIKIVARRGKSTYNQTTPNSVCINDFTKNEFFKNCREFHGPSGCFMFSTENVQPYTYWNDVIDKEYARQYKKVNGEELKNR